MSNDEGSKTETVAAKAENTAEAKEVEMEDADTPEKEAETKDTKDDGDDEQKEEDEDDKMTDAEKEEKAKKEKEEKERKEKEAEAERKRIEELKKKYANWPLRGIKDPHENDVMYGRGGGTNHHPGNKRYRKMVEDRKVEYVNSKRLDKPLVALEIIRLWRAQLPPGRFLKLDEKTGLWNDVGDKKAREKTSQALREKAPLIRKQQEEADGKSDDEKEKKEEKEGGTKTTRFAAGTKEESGSKTKKPLLARDHSLGREYIEAGDSVSLEGFTWQDPFQVGDSKRTPSFGSSSGGSQPPHAAAYPPAGRHSSSGSMGIAPPQHGPPPPPDYYGRISDGAPRQYSNGRYDSWGSPYPYAPPPPPPAVHGPTHQRSGSWTHPPPPPPGIPSHQRSGSWNGREHSLAFNPLIGASVAHPADRGTFDSTRSSSGYWTYRSPPRHTSPTNSTPSPKPQYSVGMDIARTWSGGSGGRSWSMERPDGRQAMPPSYYDGHPQPVPGADQSPARNADGSLPRPQIVKRDTSHQNENVETKHSVKRAALNRDNSLASNRLKQEYMPEYYNGNFNSEQEVRRLSVNLEQSTLVDSSKKETTKPEPLKNTNRVSTFDAITNELMSKPGPLLASDRISTIDALDIDLEVDPTLDQQGIQQPFEVELNDTKGDIPKPKAMTSDNRITTNEFLDIVNSAVDIEDDPLELDKTENPPPLNNEAVAENWLTGK